MTGKLIWDFKISKFLSDNKYMILLYRRKLHAKSKFNSFATEKIKKLLDCPNLGNCNVVSNERREKLYVEYFQNIQAKECVSGRVSRHRDASTYLNTYIESWLFLLEF